MDRSEDEMPDARIVLGELGMEQSRGGGTLEWGSGDAQRRPRAINTATK